MSLLEDLWQSQQQVLKEEKPVSFYLIELVAVLERTLTFAYTGDARTIATGLMHPFGLQRSLLENGLPTIVSSIEMGKEIAETFAMQPDLWPMTRDHVPAVASKRAILLTYKAYELQVSGPSKFSCTGGWARNHQNVWSAHFDSCQNAQSANRHAL